MCGRFTQYQAEVRYLEKLNWQTPLAFEPNDQPLERYNVAPTSNVQLLHVDESGLQMSSVPWGYAPYWAQGTGKRPPAINARLESAVTSRYWSTVWKNGRCLIPADGWYEWVKDLHDAKLKRPFYIKRRTGEPMFFAGIAQMPKSVEGIPIDKGGFAIVTSASDQGMVDIHDRMPVVMPPDVAKEWLEPGLAPEGAENLARHHAAPVDSYEWYEVDRQVGNVRNQGPHLIKPSTPSSS